MPPKKVCVVVGSRANYSSIKAAMTAIQAHPDLELQVIAGASAVLDRYGSVIEIMRADGFAIDEQAYMLLEGETPLTMAKSTAVGLMELPVIFNRLRPDVMLTVGDRFETMATTLAAAYMNIPLAHTMGGEVSGNIDENIRHATTKFANIHFPASEDARLRIIRMGEEPDLVHNVGCPRMDLVAEVLGDGLGLDHEAVNSGVGAEFDPSSDFLLLSQHPVTNDYGCGEEQITNSLLAAFETGLPTLVLWPNADSGSEEVSRGIRKFRERHPSAPFRYVKNLRPADYIKLMARTRCLVGNSSSAIREGAFIGTPAVNVGTRQINRERGNNVVDAGNDKQQILAAINDRLALGGRMESNPIYGDGNAGPRIAKLLAETSLRIEKRITY